MPKFPLPPRGPQNNAPRRARRPRGHARPRLSRGRPPAGCPPSKPSLRIQLPEPPSSVSPPIPVWLIMPPVSASVTLCRPIQLAPQDPARRAGARASDPPRSPSSSTGPPSVRRRLLRGRPPSGRHRAPRRAGRARAEAEPPRRRHRPPLAPRDQGRPAVGHSHPACLVVALLTRLEQLAKCARRSAATPSISAILILLGSYRRQGSTPIVPRRSSSTPTPVPRVPALLPARPRAHARAPRPPPPHDRLRTATRRARAEVGLEHPCLPRSPAGIDRFQPPRPVVSRLVHRQRDPPDGHLGGRRNGTPQPPSPRRARQAGPLARTSR